MPSKTAITVATQFVELGLKYDKKEWKTTRTLPAQEVAILFNTVLTAGFEAWKVIVGHLIYQDGPTGEIYPINGTCPFKVLDEEDRDHHKATIWLDRMLCRVLNTDSREDREQLTERIELLIEESIPLTPIQLTPEGDFLCEYPTDNDKHTRDSHSLGSCVGVHKYCGSFMDRHRATANHDAIVCRGCHLRVLFQREIKTYGELREALAISLLAKKSLIP